MTAPRFAHALDPRPRTLTLGDGLIFLALAGLLSAGASLALHAPKLIQGPTISLSARALPWYALISTGRMAVAYAFALLFSFTYGYLAAKHQSAGRILIPILDVLQSVRLVSWFVPGSVTSSRDVPFTRPSSS